MINSAGFDIVYPVAIAALVIGAAAAAVVFVAGLRRFELAVALVLISTWMHFGAVSNVYTEDLETLLVQAEAPSVATYLRLGFIGLAGLIGLARFSGSPGLNKGSRLPLVLLGLFICLAFASATYSIEPRFTFVRSVEFIAFFCFLLGMCVWLQGRPQLDAVLNILFYTVAVSIIVNASAAVLFPSYIWHWRAPNRYQGLVGHPNTLGLFCLMAYPVLLWKYRHASIRVKVAVVALGILAVVMHLMSGSRASMAAAAAGILVWLLSTRQRGGITALAMLGIVLMMMPVMSESIPSLQRQYQGEEASTITNLTGRTQFWQLAAHLVAEKPITGYGYEVGGGVWSDSGISEGTFVSQWGSSKTSLHNGYLEVVLGTGLVGFALWLLVLVMPLRRLVLTRASDYRAYALVMMVQFLIINLFESAISTSRSTGSLGFWLAWALALRLPHVFTRDARVRVENREANTALEPLGDV